MTIPYDYYRFLIQSNRGTLQINNAYDANGDEVYSGVSESRALATDPIWAIGKAVYTPTLIGSATVNLITHWSFLTGVAWSNRAALVFP